MLLRLTLLLLMVNSAAAQSHRPNLLFIFSDDQRYDTVHSLGNAEIQTLVLDSLVARGFHFDNVYCQGSMLSAVCVPSRTMLMTGKALFHIPDYRAKSYDGPLMAQPFRAA